MPRKSKDKEINEVKVAKVIKTKAEKKPTVEKKKTPTKAKVAKETKKETKVKASKTSNIKSETKVAKKKSTTSKKTTDTIKTTVAKKEVKTSAKKATPKKEATIKKATKPKSKEVKTNKAKTTSKTKAIETKSTTKAKSTENSSTKSKTATKAKSVKPKTTAKAKTKTTRTKKATTPSLPVLEYYDLPYRYNHTVVKVLAQNPTTLFVYWDINDTDRKNFEKSYGDNFFSITKPVLVIHNLTDNYSYEIDINDFANNWYIHDCNTKSKYSIELGRRPIEYSKNINTDYINVSYSNTMEIPNDHILFFKENDKIYFKNIKTNKITEKTFKNSIYANNLREIYKDYSISENQNEFDLNAPSSNFLSSNVL